MSTTITRYCDRCKKEITNPEQIWLVQILILNESTARTNRYGASFYNQASGNAKKQEWCRRCADELNLVGMAYTPPKDEPTTKAPTFEDQLRQIIRNEIDAATGASA